MSNATHDDTHYFFLFNTNQSLARMAFDSSS